ncbi:peptidoglycan-binding domain-containing protein [Roseovarius sp. CAU 1744]|uniref:peptidoglycan-binding domain-containing protein n=1 Tax=Roseovarius sp. CAU 1744 TaxID=3140368 RepID=UPI00325BE2E1
MRAHVLSVILWISLMALNLPGVALAQYQGGATGQTGRPGQTQEPINPLLQGIIEHFVDEVTRPGAAEPTEPRGGGTSQDDVQAADRQGPVIRPRQEVFSSDRGSARIIADITDASGIARAVAGTEAGRVAMTRAGGPTYVANVRLAAHYRPVRVTIQAWDGRGNASAIIPVAIRRVPVCGRVDDVTADAVRAVQRNLAALGLYGGGIDGLAGPNTCRAVTQAGITGAFSWPAIARALDRRLAIRQISLRVTVPDEVTADLTSVTVSVIDPGNTGEVAWVQMRVDGAQALSQRATGGGLLFGVETPEGSTRQVSFAALPRQGATPLATTAITLERPEALRLFLTGEGLTGNLIESDAAETSVMASLEGAGRGRVFYDNPGNGQRGVVEFFGTPVEMPVVMPAPGQGGAVVLWAQEGRRSTARRRIELRRIRLIAPDVPVLTLTLFPVPEPDAAPDLVPGSAGPPYRGTGPLPITVLTADGVPGPVPPPPPVPQRGRPIWQDPMTIAGVALIVLLGLVAWLLRRAFRRQDAKMPSVPPSVHVIAHPDATPVIEVTGGELPELVLTVDDGVGPVTKIVFEAELERVNQ